MSGGHFCNNGYIYYQVSQFADELQHEIGNNDRKNEWGHSHSYSPEVLGYLEGQVFNLRRMSEIMRAIDYLYSGDHGEESFLKVVREIEVRHRPEDCVTAAEGSPGCPDCEE